MERLPSKAQKILATRILTGERVPLKLPLFFPKYFPLHTAYETHLPALQTYPQTPVWLPCAHENEKRSRDSFAPPRAGTQASPAEGCRNSLRPPHAGLSAGSETGDEGARSFGCRGDSADSRVRLKFPKTARLKQAGEFQKLKREGVSFHGKYMVLSVLKVQPVTEARIGIITSRRVGPAVIRNRVRRRFREFIRADRSRLQSSYWIVLIARQRAAGATLLQVQAEWRMLAARATVFLP